MGERGAITIIITTAVVTRASGAKNGQDSFVPGLPTLLLISAAPQLFLALLESLLHLFVLLLVLGLGLAVPLVSP